MRQEFSSVFHCLVYGLEQDRKLPVKFGESKILIKKTVSFKGKKKTKHRNHVGKDFKADGILWLFLNNSGFRSVKELVYFVIFSQLFFLNLFRINT